MPASSLLGAIFAITSAAVWGGGDFSGGMATRKSNQYQVVILASLSGMVAVSIGAFIRGESWPSLLSTTWAILAGLSGAMGVAALYRALSLGHTASTAPISAITCAIIPVAFGLISTGLPKASQLVGFIIAFIGIWLVSRSSSRGEKTFREGMTLAFLSGLGFGGFFVFIAQVHKGEVFIPVLVARSVTFIIAFLMLRMKQLPFPRITSNPVAILAGILDTGGNIFYLLATQFVRLDVAAVLSSFYPASTVILATIILKEKVSWLQWVGVGTCLLAAALITI